MYQISQQNTPLFGICIPPRPYLLGLSTFEQWEHKDETGDAVIYALTKFVRLALACNPNIIELLYTDARHVLFANDYGQQLVDHRYLFLTKQARHTFAGYAISQLRRIERHHRWLVNPPDHKPTQQEFGGWPAEGRYKFPDHDAERAYRAALTPAWQEYGGENQQCLSSRGWGRTLRCEIPSFGQRKEWCAP